MQQMPNMAAMAGEQPQAQQQQTIQPQAVQGAMNAQKPEAQLQVLIQKMMQVLQETGYFDLPENKSRRGEINKELMDIAQALLDGNAEFVKNSEIYQYITAQKGQRTAMQPAEQQMQMPDMEGMV
jgi:hypothetical protein